MSNVDAQHCMGSYQDGYLAAIQDAIRVYKIGNGNFIEDMSFMGIAVINEAQAKIDSFEQLAKDLGLSD